MHRKTWLRTALRETDVLGSCVVPMPRGASHCHKAPLGLAMKPFLILRTDGSSLRLRWAQVETLYFIKWMMFS